MSAEDTEVEKELELINRRYDELERRLTDVLEDLRIVRLWADKVESVQSMQEWVASVDIRLTESRPTSKELMPLGRELDKYQVGRRRLLIPPPPLEAGLTIIKITKTCVAHISTLLGVQGAVNQKQTKEHRHN